MKKSLIRLDGALIQWNEALLLDHEGNISEGAVANIFLVIDNTLITPPTDSILPGITRTSVLLIAQQLNIATKKTVTIHDISLATEAFFAGTASEITSIKSIEQHSFSPTALVVTDKIKNAYHAITSGGNIHFKSWLTFIQQ